MFPTLHGNASCGGDVTLGQSIASCVGKPVGSIGPTPGVPSPAAGAPPLRPISSWIVGAPLALEPATAIPGEPLAASLPPTLAPPWFSALPPHPSASRTKAVHEAPLVVP